MVIFYRFVPLVLYFSYMYMFYCLVVIDLIEMICELVFIV